MIASGVASVFMEHTPDEYDSTLTWALSCFGWDALGFNFVERFLLRFPPCDDKRVTDGQSVFHKCRDGKGFRPSARQSSVSG